MDTQKINLAYILPGHPFFVLLGLLVAGSSICLLATPNWPLAVLPGLVLLLLLLMRKHPDLAYYAVVFLIPFGQYRSIGESLKIHWILAFYLLLVMSLKIIFYRSIPQQMRTSLW